MKVVSLFLLGVALLLHGAIALAQSSQCPARRLGQDCRSGSEGRESGRVDSTQRRIAKVDGADFSQRYGISVEFVPARGRNIIRRMVDEAKAGVHYFDVHIGGTESVITGLLPENMLEPVEPFFVLPEVGIPNNGGAAISGPTTRNDLSTPSSLIRP